jgi:hypothetical protein
MKSPVGFVVCAVGGLLLLIGGLLIPAHLRAVDGDVIRAAGASSTSLVDHGLALVREKQLGSAQLLLAAASSANVPDREKLRVAVTQLAAGEPVLNTSGGNASPALGRLFSSEASSIKNENGLEPITTFVVRLENRDAVLEFLNRSQNSAVQELLRCRAISNTVLFPPSSSASGQAFDAAISVAGLLLDQNALTTQMRDKLFSLAANANHGAGSQPLEMALLDFMSLGQRFNWGQLAAFVAHIEDTDTLDDLAAQLRTAADVPVLFTAVELSGRPAAVSRYLLNFSQSGSSDLAASLRSGAGGVNELVNRNVRIAEVAPFNRSAASFVLARPFYHVSLDLALRAPGFAVALKWTFYLASGFLIAFAMHFARPVAPLLERPLEVRGFHIAREILFALGFLVVILLLSEPFLSQESQKVDLPIHVHLPTVGNIVPAKFTQNHPQIMNQLSLLTLLLFFVLQGLLYVASLLKLAEIRRQQTSARVKLRLLENEDHLFDAGLYLGFVGTIISLILVSLGVIKPSLMAAYSSTSFGIIFVSLFKICNLRPARRTLLLEVEAQPDQTVATPTGTPVLVSTP